MASFSSFWILCPAVVMTVQAFSVGAMDVNTFGCATGSEPLGVELLQKGSLPLAKALKNVTYPTPVGLGVVPVATEFADSKCTAETGTVYSLPLDSDPCDFLWTFKCTCDHLGYEALRGRHWIDGNCSSSNTTYHSLPVGVCFTLPQMDTYIMISDFLLCPPCHGAPSLLEEDHTGEDINDDRDDKDIAAAGALAAAHTEVQDTKTNAAHQAVLGNGQRVLDEQQEGKPDKLIVRMYTDNKCTNLIEEYYESPSVCAAKTSLGGKPSATYNCACNGDDRAILYLNWVADWCDPSQGIYYDHTFPAGECSPAPTGLTWVKINAQACPKCCSGASSCTVHGDPHITVFDGDDDSVVTLLTHPRTSITDGAGREDMFDWGDYWLVKSEQVLIQARYRKVYYPNARQPLNNTYLTAVAIGGPFLHDHTLIIEPREGSVTWLRRADPNSAVNLLDKEAEAEFERGGIIRAIYHNRTALVPELKDTVPGLDVELPSEVKVFIDRFQKHLDFKVEMPAEAGGPKGVDGQCGNYNGDASDDTADLIGRRIGFQVPAKELLFAQDSEEE